jgi:hypothetical protein
MKYLKELWQSLPLLGHLAILWVVIGLVVIAGRWLLDKIFPEK